MNLKDLFGGESDSDKSNIMLILVIVCVVLCLVSIIGYFIYNGMNTKTEMNPKTQILNLGQMIQKDELEISSKAIPFVKIPSGIITTNPVSYTMSFDCYFESIGLTYQSIFNTGIPGPRVPAVFITGKDYGSDPHVHIVHGTKEDGNRHMFSSFTVPFKQWFNITFTVDNNKLSTYFNGIEDRSATGTFYWGNVDMNKWVWNKDIDEFKNVGIGSVKVKNAVFWNKPLTTSQINIISKQ